MSIDWNWGYSCNRPLRQHYLPAGCGAVFKSPSPSPSRRIIAFLVGSLFGILRTVPNRFLSGIGTCYVELFRNVPLIVQFFTVRWCQSSCRKISACGLNRSWTQTFNSLSPPCCAGLFTAARVCEQVRAAIQSLPRGQKNAGGDGPDPAANLPLRATAERLPRYCAADDLGDDEPVKTRPSPPPSVWPIWPRRRANCWTTPLMPSLYRHHPAYVFINAVIMLIMYVVERKVRLPAIWEANNVRF